MGMAGYAFCACRYPVSVPINEWSDSIQVAELQNDPSFAEDMATLAATYQMVADGLKAGRTDLRARDVILDMRHVQFLNTSRNFSGCASWHCSLGHSHESAP
jgi:hypothetical protein